MGGANLSLSLQFSVLVLVEFVALMVVAAPLVQVEAQVTAADLLVASSSVSLMVVRLEQMDGAVDEVFLNVTPLHRIEPYVQRELNKLQLSVSKSSE